MGCCWVGEDAYVLGDGVRGRQLQQRVSQVDASPVLEISLILGFVIHLTPVHCSWMNRMDHVEQ